MTNAILGIIATVIVSVVLLAFLFFIILQLRDNYKDERKKNNT